MKINHLFAITLYLAAFSSRLIAEIPEGEQVDAAFSLRIPHEAREGFFNQTPAPHLLADPDYFIWGLTAFRWTDGKVHAYCSRWPKSTGFNGWFSHSEIVHAVADRPEGPFKMTDVVLKTRNSEGWDIANAHNPSVCIVDGKIYLYYISEKLRGEFEATKENPFPTESWFKANWEPKVRNTQCIGVAIADDPAGPFKRHPEPVVVPHGKFKNIAVNPAVTYHDGTFVMIMKGDDVRKQSPYRIQYVGHSDNAAGPFIFQEQSIYEDAQTEDACIWYDQKEELFNTVFHVMNRKDLVHLVSKDGVQWDRAEPFVFVKKRFNLPNGQVWEPHRVERPFVLVDERGSPEWIYLAVLEGGEDKKSGNLAIQLNNPNAQHQE